MSRKMISSIVKGSAVVSACGLSLWLGACGETASDERGGFAETTGALVTGATDVSPHDTVSEAEAVMTIAAEPNGQTHTIVAANADDPSKVTFSDGGTIGIGDDDSRTIQPGASKMVMYHRFGLSGSYTATRLAPPDGGALWGGPAITSRGSYVFATSLQIPIGDFPVSGASRGPIVNQGDDVRPSGACIARSFDYGQSWSLGLPDCVSHNGGTYVASSIATNSQGKIFAAFLDWNGDHIDVWRTEGPTGSLSLTGNPFPGKTMINGPRLKISSAGDVYVMATELTNSNTKLWVSQYVNRAWQAPVLVASDPKDGFLIPMSGGIQVAFAPGFDFSAYRSPVDGSPELAFVYTTIPNGRSVLKAGTCSASSGTLTCAVIPGAESNSSVWSFNPAIATSTQPTLTTKITYQRRRSTGDKVALWASSLDFTSSLQVSGWQAPCPDLEGHWGDYDSMDVASDGFHRVFSDSVGTTCIRQRYSEIPLSVVEAVIPLN